MKNLPSSHGSPLGRSRGGVSDRLPRATAGNNTEAEPHEDPSSESSAHPTLVEPRSPRIRGMPLSTRMSIAIAMVTFISTLTVGLVVAYIVQSQIKREIYKAGIGAVNLVASQGRSLIYDVYRQGKPKDMRELTTQVNLRLEHSHREDLLNTHFKDLEPLFLNAHVTVRLPYAANRVHPLFSYQVDSNSNFEIQTKMVMETDSEPKISIKSGSITVNGAYFPVYEFVQDIPIKDLFASQSLGDSSPNAEATAGNVDSAAADSNIGLTIDPAGENTESSEPSASTVIPKDNSLVLAGSTARVFLNTAKIEETVLSIYKTTGYILGLCFFISIVIALLLARSITRPVLALVGDMYKVANGDLDHKTLATTSDEVGYLATTFNNLTRTLKAAREMEMEKERMSHELKLGHEIQKGLLPKNTPRVPGYDINAFYLAANEVGGDYFDFIVLDKSHLGIVVADVSGKGIPGSMQMTIMRTVMNIAAHGNLSPQKVLVRTNRFVSERIKRGMFITTYLITLDCKNHTMKMASAGHNALVLYRAATRSIELPNPKGMAIGFDKGPLFEKLLREEETILGSGDRVVLYTDGVVESMNDKREEFSDKRFHEFVVKNAHLDSKSFVEKLVKEVKKHQGSAPQHDDITIVTLKKL
ncbi:MAG: PP2C family protein-serine/threonine phosphatase [Planctomycetes bacterium]|nr:PP2C family protein-serine/threonine phosphatase [Planctomycetota bacterium]